jgi:hypothetical protein
MPSSPPLASEPNEVRLVAQISAPRVPAVLRFLEMFAQQVAYKM